jgi:DNA (cytosine-5)-methyltransferase 1
MSRRPTTNSFVSLFCGCGGFDLGLMAQGFKPLAGYDINEEAIRHYKDNVCEKGDVADLSAQLPKLSKKPEVVIAGPPCQGFSTAGRRDLGDHRNHLLPLAGERAVQLGAKVVVIENVAAAASGAHRVYWEALDGYMRGQGYRTNTIKCNAADIGLPQSRKRLLLFAWKTGRDIPFEMPPSNAARLDEMLQGVENLPDHDPQPLVTGSRPFKIAARIGPGQKLSNARGGVRSIHTWHIPEVFGKTTAAECCMLEFVMRARRQNRRRDFGDADPVSLAVLKKEFGQSTDKLIKSLIAKEYLRKVGHYYDLTHTFNGKFRRFRWDDIACTVDTRFGEPQLFLHPNEHRPFTVREAARIQGFPDDYRFDCSSRSAFRLIGNAVPPPMGNLAGEFAKQLLGS